MAVASKNKKSVKKTSIENGVEIIIDPSLDDLQKTLPLTPGEIEALSFFDSVDKEAFFCQLKKLEVSQTKIR